MFVLVVKPHKKGLEECHDLKMVTDQLIAKSQKTAKDAAGNCVQNVLNNYTFYFSSTTGQSTVAP